MTACDTCGAKTDWPAVDLGVVVHGHLAPGTAHCAKHGAGQPVVALHVDGRASPLVACRACWSDVYAHANAFLRHALGALHDHNRPKPIPAAGVPPGGLDLGAILRNVREGKCWCGRPVDLTHHSLTGASGRCSAGHVYGVHRFDGGPA